ncbi:MAG: hypothetical protein KF699_11370 [Phycisphaeraceae bacterium]|nr:hypothetical protein [Phycisphaeraceae bacterium]MBX3406533.1 hypothetical protein [Phycisphaeraceae bacterium]
MHFIVRIESFDGRDTFLHCGNGEQDHLFAVVGVDADGRAEIVDSAYRSYEEAAAAWPEAARAKGQEA